MQAAVRVELTSSGTLSNHGHVVRITLEACDMTPEPTQGEILIP